MSEAGEGEKEKKAKPTLVRLSQKQTGGVRDAVGASPLSASPRNSLNQSFGSRSSIQSFKPKRDLTLGTPNIKSAARPLLDKKKFVPNLNVSRQIKKEPDPHPKNNSLGKRKKENKHEKRERNSKDRPALIQTESIFSEGAGGDLVARRRAALGGGGGYRDESGNDSSQALMKPKLELGKHCDRAEEDRKLKLLLNDDFIDDLKHGNFLPIQLPMIETGSMFKSEVKKEPSTSETDDIIKPKLLNKKSSELDSDDDEDAEDDNKLTSHSTKPVITEDVAASSTSGQSVARLLQRSDSQLIFFQLPDTIPLPPDPETPDMNPSLTGLEGRLGELEIRQSGRCQIILGQHKFDIEEGTKVGFLQDLVSIRVPPNTEETGDLTILGHISDRLVLSPDWDSLLQDSGFDQDLA